MFGHLLSGDDEQVSQHFPPLAPYNAQNRPLCGLFLTFSHVTSVWLKIAITPGVSVHLPAIVPSLTQFSSTYEIVIKIKFYFFERHRGTRVSLQLLERLLTSSLPQINHSQFIPGIPFFNVLLSFILKLSTLSKKQSLTCSKHACKLQFFSGLFIYLIKPN